MLAEEWMEKKAGTSSPPDTRQNFTPAAGGLSVTYDAAAGDTRMSPSLVGPANAGKEKQNHRIAG